MSYVAYPSITPPTHLKLAFKYGPAILLLLALGKHFGASKKKQEEGMARWLPSFFFALRSKTLRNMLLGAGVVTLLSKKVFGFKRISRIFPAFFITIWGMIYSFRIVESPRIWYRRTYWNTHIVEKAKITSTEFWPVFWAFNRHAQTVTCFVLSALEWLWAPTILYRRETIPCHDPPNEQFLDWAYFEEDDHQYSESTLPGQQDYDTSDEDEEASSGSQWQTPIVVCVHGLGDDKDTPYIKRFVRMCLKNGWRVVVWSYWRFDFEESRDLHLMIKHIQQKYPRAPISAIGWSAGCYSLVRYLEKAGRETPLVCAIVQSGCLDFVQAVKDVTDNENTTYPLFLLKQVHICINRHVMNDKRITDKAKFSKMIYENIHPMKLFNKFYTMLPPPVPASYDSPLQRYCREGYVGDEGSTEDRVKTAGHYVSPAIDSIEKIKLTTLILHAEDDPIVSSEHVDWGKLETNRHVIVAHTRRGGHCAWHEGLMPFGDTWGDRVSTNFISTILESHSQTHFIVQLVKQVGNMPQRKTGELTPQAMARICSASDLASVGSPPLAMRTRDSLLNLSKWTNHS